MGIFGQHHVKNFWTVRKGGNPRSRHGGAFSFNSAASLASSVRHYDKNRTGSRGSEG